MTITRSRDPETTLVGGLGSGNHRDTGCPDGVHPSCLKCPLDVCRFEGGREPANVTLARERAEAVAKATAKGAMPDDVAAELGISRRSVYRLANVANSLATPTTGKEAPMASIDEIGAATIQTLRTTMTRVRDAEQLVARAQQQLESAREASADEARRLTNALNALGVEIPTDLSLSVRAVIYPPRGRGAARPMVAVPAQTCPDCNQPVKGTGGLAIHRARSHKAS